MSLAGVFNKLGQTVLPAIATTVFPDLMNITGETIVPDTGGRPKKTVSPNVYTNVPVSYEPTDKNSRTTGERAVSLNEYTLTFPTHQSGSRINIDPKVHRLKVLTRGNEPEKVFRIVSIKDSQGVIFEAVCEKEN